MPATIRLTRMGRKKHPFYRLVVVDSRARRDGAYIEKLGYYNPFSTPYEVELDHDKTIEWLGKGVGMSDTARGLLRNEGVLYRWHLMKSGLPVGEVEAKVEEFRTRHGAKLDAQRSKTASARDAELAKQAAAEKAKLKAKAAEAEAPAEEEVQAEAAAPADEATAEESGDAPADETKTENGDKS